MEGACIGVYIKERLVDSSRKILKIYERYFIEDTPLFLITLEWHQIPTYTEFERQQLTWESNIMKRNLAGRVQFHLIFNYYLWQRGLTFLHRVPDEKILFCPVLPLKM